MRWITDKQEFEKLILDARTCVYTDSGRHETKLERLQFDDADLCTKSFGLLLKTLMEWAGQQTIYFTVLEPDPVDYFHHRYGMYPCFELESGDFPEKILEALNTPYANQPGEVLGIAYMEYVITSPTMPWFIHALRTHRNNGGHLWVPKGWPERIFEFDRAFVEAREHPRKKLQ